MHFSKATLVLALTLVTYASASALPQTNQCAGLLSACSGPLNLKCCDGLTCIPPGFVSSSHLRET